jgi:hypothetical protein
VRLLWGCSAKAARCGSLTDVNARPRLFHRIAGALENAGLLLLVVLFLPAAILLLGTPIVLAVRAVLELVRRF